MKDPEQFTNSSIWERLRERFPNEADSILPRFDWDLITDFTNFLRAKNEEGGFFSKRDGEEILDRHVLESVYHVFKIDETISSWKGIRLGDAGTGPGIPGFFFRCLLEHPIVFLLDSQKRKLAHTENFVKKNRISDVQFHYLRTEESKFSLDYVVSRGFIPYPFSVEAVCNLIKVGGTYVPFLAKHDIDIKLEERTLSNCGFVLNSSLNLPSLDFLGMRHIKFLKKVSSPRHGYPRAWKDISKESKGGNGKDRIH
ncbi:16S rRNA (guanine(527)-N(7))-methyltransferase RsmG [Leptospira gomenensis]|uniref:Ribosomal RNA small subunit methyltransferase G n=1 Tax=Leptospira gomenensis TaxID=2484974 RepID=A0A5F1Y5U9_9LEPT|nr:RsmG family class I SAM-dependent methyltransferase [Leptospira gomenensis]TGK27999.1 16S rRNA (guanine(527)-N(7))-methyltransferase RsmG [Leptospira gomenensis]TGK37146.1 16S rRNA (guanine(527)-N(7))-methyltransferase RsmG [Leptospira gomenensis]TGK45782.1 16S rRNA (guanine(527)-N(7))-methyltransferase RsmG [Leptospira gomenensis]TGK59721.1 16S rRNA (guanine(527)-N(7))-methyltransferase RsmG [Leptospira gomenensis]